MFEDDSADGETKNAMPNEGNDQRAEETEDAAGEEPGSPDIESA